MLRIVLGNHQRKSNNEPVQERDEDDHESENSIPSIEDFLSRFREYADDCLTNAYM